MTRIFTAAAALCGILALTPRAGAQDFDFKFAPLGKNLAPSIQDRLDAAALLVGNNPNLRGMLTLCIDLKSEWGDFRKDNARQTQVLPPTKVFDQLYAIGTTAVMTWAIVTSDGIIQIDGMHNADEAEKIVVAGYKKLGLDPKQIKYVILTHSHSEHYGGGKYLQDTYHPRVLMGGPDWDVIEKTPNPPPAKRDISVTGEQKLTLGNETITLYLEPGHTPGSLDLTIPVTDHGQPHVVSFVGGTGIPHGMDALLDYKKNFEHFFKVGEDLNVDAMISNHPWFDNTFTDGGKTDKYTRSLTRKATDPNPWVVGQSEYVNAMMANLECLESSIARLRETDAQ